MHYLFYPFYGSASLPPAVLQLKREKGARREYSEGKERVAEMREEIYEVTHGFCRETEKKEEKGNKHVKEYDDVGQEGIGD